MQNGDLRAMFHRLTQALRKQWMILAQEAADDQHAVERGKFSDRHAEPGYWTWFAPGYRIGGEIRLPEPEVDVVAAQAPRQLLREIQLLERRVWRRNRADSRASLLPTHALESAHYVFKRGLPVRLAPRALALDHRLQETALGVQTFIRKPVAIGKPAVVDRLVFLRNHAHDAIVLDLHNQVAAEAVVRRDRSAARELPGPRQVPEGLRGQRADGTQIDHVAGQFRVDGVADEGQDLDVLAAVSETELHDARDFLTEAHTARAVDAAGHVGGDQRTQVLVEHHPLRLGVARARRAVADGEILQLAFAALVANRAVQRMIDEQEFHHSFLRDHRWVGMGPDFHALRCGGGARGQGLGRFLDLHQAHPAIGGDGQLLVPAEMRHVDV